MEVDEVTLDEAGDLVGENNAILLDVREAEEHVAARIDSSIHIPIDELKDRVGELPTGKIVIVYCHMGARSFEACKFLREKGFNAVNLKGGISAWMS